MDFLVELIAIAVIFTLSFIGGQQIKSRHSGAGQHEHLEQQIEQEDDKLSDEDENDDDIDDEKESPLSQSAIQFAQPSPVALPTASVSGATQPPLPSQAIAAAKKKRRRIVIVAKTLPVRSTRITPFPTATPTDASTSTTGDGEHVSAQSLWRFEWEDTRNFLSALKILQNHNEEFDLMWVGAPNTDTVIERDEEDLYEEGLYDFNCIPVFLRPELNDKFYNGFCKSMLWPMLHYVLPSDQHQHFGEVWDDRWQAYTAANSAYASVVTHALETPQDMILIQNYHLLLLPSFLRAKLPRVKIGLFVHTPFPSSDVFRVLPSRQNILSSILATDLLGFHTFDYARHFLSCIKRVMDLDFETLPGGALGVKYNGRFVSISISHVGIDSPTFIQLSHADTVVARVSEIQRQFNARKIILGIDDYDVVKGPLLKLQAYRQFLRDHSELRLSVVFVQMLMPASSIEQESVKQSLRDEITKIHREYGTDALIVMELNDAHKLSQAEMTAWFRATDVCCVSTLWDGLNLLPYEFSACQSQLPRPGALILSEFMGCSRSLNGVIRVNPWSLTQVSEAIKLALSQSDEERLNNHSRRYHYVINHSIQKWGLGFVDQLDRATRSQSSMNYVHIGWGSNVKLVGLRSDFTHLDEDSVATGYRKANKRVLLLDYDGTLTPLEKSSTQSSANVSQPRSRLIGPTAEVKRILKALCDDEDNCVFIMSGRTRSVLTEWFDDMPKLGLAAEKGLFLRWPARLMAQCRDDDWKPEDSRYERQELAQRQIELNQQSVSSAPDYNDESSVPVIANDWECLIPLDENSSLWKEMAMSLIRSYTEQTDGSWIEPKEFAIVWHYENADPEYGRMQAAELQKYLIKLLANPAVDVVKYDYARVLEVKPHGISKGLAASAILESLFLKAKIQKSPSHANMLGLTLQRELTVRESSFGTATNLHSPSSNSSSPMYSSQLPPTSRPTSPPSSSVVAAASSIDAKPEPFLLCIGDDRSDEDMFVAINEKEYLKGRIRGDDSLAPQLVRSTSKPSEESKSSPADAVANDVSIALVGARKDEEDEKWDTDTVKPKSPPDPFTFTVCVGMKPSNAHYYLQDEEEVLRTLASLSTASKRMAQTRAIDAANGTMQRTLSMSSLVRSQTSGGSVQNLMALNSLSVGANSRSRQALALAARGGSQHALAPMSPVHAQRTPRNRSHQFSDDDDDDDEQEYGSDSDEDGAELQY